MVRAAAMLAGSSYAFLLAVTVLRDVRVPGRMVHPQTALSYAVLLAVLVMIRLWYGSRGCRTCRLPAVAPVSRRLSSRGDARCCG
jgi:hypothetical protein